MKIYKAYLKQENGCDYTIGCGRKVIDIKGVTSMDDAKLKLEKIIEEEYNYMEAKIDSAEIFEIEQVLEINTTEIYGQIEYRKNIEKQTNDEKKEREEFERLKEKFT
jgi:hypothetical protein